MIGCLNAYMYTCTVTSTEMIELLTPRSNSTSVINPIMTDRQPTMVGGGVHGPHPHILEIQCFCLFNCILDVNYVNYS